MYESGDDNDDKDMEANEYIESILTQCGCFDKPCLGGNGEEICGEERENRDEVCSETRKVSHGETKTVAVITNCR